ncbi:MAG: hypothetical protein WCO25_02600 [Candidatus Uhrbacteria bacterium]
MPRIPGFSNSISPKTLFVLIVIPMFAAAIILRIVFSFAPPPRPDLLPKADGMIETTTAADAQLHTEMGIVLPSDMLGGEIYAAGVYTKAAGSLPVGSAIFDLVKDNQRFVEIVERPSTSLPDVTNDYRANGTQTVNLGKTTGSMLLLATNRIPCVSSNEKWNLPGFCEIPKVLIFEMDGVVISIGADGTHATDGELITMAKDILGPVVAAVPAETPTTFTFKEAGIDPLFDGERNLAIIKKIETNGNKRFVTFDPVETVDCRDIATRGEPMPAECPSDLKAEGLTIDDLFRVVNPDASTQTMEMAPDAGPYFPRTSPDESERFWTTIGTFETPSDPPTTQRLFHVVVDKGIVTKIAEHPQP